jgi:hypothetical protein
VLADAVVRQIWHDGYPHRKMCRDLGCKFKAYAVFRQRFFRCASLISWRKQEVFKLPSGRDMDIPSGRDASLLRQGEPLWLVCRDMGQLWREIQRLAGAVGVPHSNVLDEVRGYLRELFEEMIKQ